MRCPGRRGGTPVAECLRPGLNPPSSAACIARYTRVPPALGLDVRLGAVSVPAFALCTDCQDEHRIDDIDMAIEGDVAARALANDQLALARTNLSTDQGTVAQDVQRPDDLGNSFGNPVDLVLCQVLEDAIEVIQDLGGQLDTSHRPTEPRASP